MNHRVQSSAASIVNRAAIALWKAIKQLELDAKIVLQVHDELVVECREQDSEVVAELIKYCMETTTILPGVDLKADPVIASNLGDLK
jgi:DNA polymerase-1